MLTGLFRVRAFTQDDAHIFCTPDQIQSEITTLLRLIEEVYGAFGFTEKEIYLSTRPRKVYRLAGAVESSRERFRSRAESCSPSLSGQSRRWEPFYGPKIDFVVRDSLRRRWQTRHHPAGFLHA
ncbi:MAG: hypothetical protein KatS3mg025_0344 [Bacteroidia bacterium]|nr:MAG: hypothetical protein KatS3mg025_0344 [Bacteroidia bacterium]